MKNFKKAISVILCFVLVCSVFAVSAAAGDSSKNKYPFVFVHGMFGWGTNEGINNIIPYWGATTGSLTDYLESNGYECVAASVGPMSSSWDQACELYAQLTGTVVDYGAAHSAEHGHDRYGREYTEPLVEGFGEEGAEVKVHLIGHSFGGNCIRMMTHLLTNGSAEEMAACDDPSPLFAGGKEDLIISCTTICSPLNGVTAYNTLQRLHLFNLLRIFASGYAAIMGRSFLNGVLVDFHLEQFGLTNTPGQSDADGLIESFMSFMQTDDMVAEDLSLQGAAANNEMIEISENVYYFSYTFDATEKWNGLYLPVNVDTWFLAVFYAMILSNGEFVDERTGETYGEEWYANDGLVNVISAQYPFDEPHKDYDADSIEKGIWNVMPVIEGDHGTPIGLFADKDETHEFYDNLAQMLVTVEKGA